MIGCPSDYGTETCLLLLLKMTLRHEHNDAFTGDKSFRFGSSTTNMVRIFYKSSYVLAIIGIEIWWSRLRKYAPDWWIIFNVVT